MTPYVQAVETEVGGVLLAEEGTTDADDATKQARGADALQQWISEHPADVNPRYGIAVEHPEPRRTELRGHQHVVRAERQRGRRRQGRAGPGARRHAAQLATLRLGPA